MDFLARDNVRHDVTRNIYEFNLETREVRELVNTGGDDLSPVVFDGGRRMIFTSDASGIRNLYVCDLETGVYKRVTDVMSGVLFPDVNEDNGNVVFTAFVKAGYDLYVSDDLEGLLANNYDSGQIASVRKRRELSLQLLREGSAGPDIPLASILAKKDAEHPGGPAIPTEGDEVVYSVSDADSLRDISVTTRRPTTVVSADEQDEKPDRDSKKSEAGSLARADADTRSGPIEGLQSPVSSDEPVTRGATVSNYKLKLSPDFIGQGAGVYFSSDLGFGLANTIVMSDLLNNHRMILSFNLFRDIADSDLYATYIYLKHRVNYGVGVFQFKNYLNSRMTSIGEAFADYRLFTERNYGMFGLISYPFDTFNRMDFELQALVSERQFFDETVDPYSEFVTYEEGDRSKRNLIEPTLSFVHDASFFNYFGPIDGSRYAISVSRGFGLGGQGVSRSTLYLDYRWYKHVFWRNSIAFRTTFAASEGDDPRAFFLGGATTLRGYDWLQFSGTRIVMSSLEYRFPAIDYLIFGWPGRWGFGNMGGTLFFDVGAAWDRNDIEWLVPDVNGLQFQDLKADIGFGTQFYFAFFLMNLQLAWPTDLRSVGGARFHFYIGPTF
jgi:hypothetical protein